MYHRWIGLFLVFLMLHCPAVGLSGSDETTAGASTFRLNIRDFGATGDGASDDTAAFQSALDRAGSSGGGQVFVPPGRYAIRTHLKVPECVTLAGIAEMPQTVRLEKGSTLLAFEGKGDENATPFITLLPNSTLKGVQIFYPEQDAKAIAPYPWCVRARGDNCSILNVLMVNPYQAADFGSTFPAGRHFINGLYAQALKRGLFIDKCLDVGRVENVHFWPFWTEAAMDWTRENGTAFIIARTDWEYMSNCFAISYAVGYHFLSREDGPGNALLTQCGSDVGPLAVKVDAVQNHSGVAFLNGQFMAGIEIGERNYGPVKFTNCGFWGLENVTDHHVMIGGGSHVTFNSCHFAWWAQQNRQSPAIIAGSGNLTVTACEFVDEDPQKGHIELRDGVETAQIVSNYFRTPPRIVNHSEGEVAIEANVGGRKSGIAKALDEFDGATVARLWRQRADRPYATTQPVAMRLAAAETLQGHDTRLRKELLESILADPSEPTSGTFALRARDELALDRDAERIARPVAAARHARKPPVIDGRIGDDEWRGATSAEFSDAGNPKLRTEIRMMWDKSALYFAATAHEPAMKRIVAKETRHDGKVWTDDSIEFFLAPRRTTHRYLQMIFNPAGTWYDGIGTLQGTNSGMWDAKPVIRTARGADSWTIEMSIDWSEMGVPAPKRGDVWAVDLRRWRQAGGAPVLAIWSGAPRSGVNHNPEAFGFLRFE